MYWLNINIPWPHRKGSRMTGLKSLWKIKMGSCPRILSRTHKLYIYIYIYNRPVRVNKLCSHAIIIQW